MSLPLTDDEILAALQAISPWCQSATDIQLYRLAYEAGLAAGAAREREACAKVCEKRAEDRCFEHGVRDESTNVWELDALGDSLNEEDDECAAAIRSRAPAEG